MSDETIRMCVNFLIDRTTGCCSPQKPIFISSKGNYLHCHLFHMEHEHQLLVPIGCVLALASCRVFVRNDAPVWQRLPSLLSHLDLASLISTTQRSGRE